MISEEENCANKQQRGINTLLAHSGNNPKDFFGFIAPPVVHASTVLYRDAEAMVAREGRYLYGTIGTPTSEALENLLNELEGAAGSVIVPSGLAAVAIPLLAFASSGDHVLIVDAVYWPTRNFCDTVLRRMGIEVEYYDPKIGGDIASLIRPNTSLVYTEGVCSNTFEVQDMPAIIAATRQAGNSGKQPVLMIDNTWATPIFFKGLDFGIDVSIQALTKYPGGHSDLVLGSVSANQQCYPRLRATFLAMGCCAGPDDCFQVTRGLRTMGVRLREHQRSALEIATWLEGRPDIGTVNYPALAAHPDHDLWKRDFAGASGLFSMTLKDRDFEAALAFLNQLKIFGLGYSWGGYDSLAVPANIRDRTVATTPLDGFLIRLQIGLEDTEDLIADLEQALEILND